MICNWFGAWRKRGGWESKCFLIIVVPGYALRLETGEKYIPRISAI